METMWMLKHREEKEEEEKKHNKDIDANCVTIGQFFGIVFVVTISIVFNLNAE